MTEELLTRARAGDPDAFGSLVDPHRRELLVHCYRLLGSLHDAEDALQETLLSAWQALPGFEGRASVRTWLYRVATSRCLDARRASQRRGLPRTLTPDPEMAHLRVPETPESGEVSWLEPYPDTLLEGRPDAAPGPDGRYELTESISLAFITALQLLPPRQRAALILRDVLGFRAREAAEILGTTEESVTSALRHARAALERRRGANADAAPAPHSPEERRLVDQLTTAFVAADVDGILKLVTDDVWFTMPPLPLAYRGREMAGRFLRATALRPGCTPILIPTRANGQPAFGLYVDDPDVGRTITVGLLVLGLCGDRIGEITRFDKDILARFDLPAVPTIEN